MKWIICISFVIVSTISSAQGVTFDSTFFHLYKTIFSTRCAVPTCHDGSFEPDFRTPVSAYETLVYHPVIKNNDHKDFRYRVVPYDTLHSVLHERITNCCFVNKNDRMPFTIGETLSTDEIGMITNWITDGAKDFDGKIQNQLYTVPFVENDYKLFCETGPSFYEDTNRAEKLYYKPALVSAKIKKLRIAFRIFENTPAPAESYSYYLKVSSDESGLGTSNTFPIEKKDSMCSVNFDIGKLEQNRQYFLQVIVVSKKADTSYPFPNEHTMAAIRQHWSFLIKN
jgi:hypothetical protein